MAIYSKFSHQNHQTRWFSIVMSPFTRVLITKQTQQTTQNAASWDRAPHRCGVDQVNTYPPEPKCSAASCDKADFQVVMFGHLKCLVNLIETQLENPKHHKTMYPNFTLLKITVLSGKWSINGPIFNSYVTNYRTLSKYDSYDWHLARLCFMEEPWAMIWGKSGPGKLHLAEIP